MERDEYAKIRRVFISAQTGQGLDLLRHAITEQSAKDKSGSGEMNADTDIEFSDDVSENPGGKSNEETSNTLAYVDENDATPSAHNLS